MDLVISGAMGILGLNHLPQDTGTFNLHALHHRSMGI